MKHFRTPPSQRREPRPTAAQIILGPEHARAAARGDITLHLRPVTSRDHRKRFHVDQRLAVRPSIGAATLCHVMVTEVRGPTFDPAPMRLAAITFDDARHAGYRTTLDLKRAWLLKHDAAWHRRQIALLDEEPEGVDRDATLDDRIQARWDRHAHKPVWAVRFVVDIAGSDRLLAARSDELYVENIARALPDEPAALSAADFDRHVARRAGMHTSQYIALEQTTRDAELEAKSLGERIDAVIAHARRTGQTIPRDVRVMEQRLAQLERTIYRRAA